MLSLSLTGFAGFAFEYCAFWSLQRRISIAVFAEVAHIWDLFRNIDSDKQQRVLRKWEEHLAEQRADRRPQQPASPALRALQVGGCSAGYETARQLHLWSALSYIAACHIQPHLYDPMQGTTRCCVFGKVYASVVHSMKRG